MKQVPDEARTALDAECRTGRFARLLAGPGLAVEGVDAAAGVVEAARAPGAALGTRRAGVRDEVPAPACSGRSGPDRVAAC